MPMLGPSMANTMFGLFAGKGFLGPRLFDHCQVIGNGSILSVIGKPFVTADIGLIPGIGVGVGIGVIGFIEPAMVGTMIGTMASFGFIGPRLIDTCQVITQSLIAEMALATLTSAHTPVFLGAGTVVPASILVIEPEWTGNIIAQGVPKGFIGPQYFNYARAIATGLTSGFLTATGVVSITGSFTGPAPPGPLPGAGAGTGVIT